MRFSIIIPAYNEEKAIRTIITRCLDVRKKIIDETNIDDIEIVVVSDGSTDGTVKIAKEFTPEVNLISYPKNRGYGRAIKTGFENASGELVSFLDADGTCDPLYFIDMIKKLNEENADICIGSRMGPGSRMPKTRKIGNKIFCAIINLIANTDISDAASGMRVIRKEKLSQLYPLPDGLNFTPAMSCRAVLDSNLKIVEVDMPYGERQGKSKLRVIKDSISFLKVIISIALTYKPLRIVGVIAIFPIIISFAYGIAALEFYLREGIIAEGHIYRLVSVIVFGVSGILLLGLAALTDKAVRLYSSSFREGGLTIGNIIRWIFSWKILWFISPLLVLSGIILNYQTIISWLATRVISTHWVYVVAGGYLVLLGIVGFTFGVIDYVFDLIREKIQGNGL